MKVRFCLNLLAMVFFPFAVHAAIPTHEDSTRRADASAQPKPFDFAEVEQKAKKLAAQPYARDEGDLPDFLTNLDYDHYRDIRFRPDKAFWKEEGLPFQLQLFHRGFLFKDRVLVNMVSNGQVQAIPYSSDLFDFGQNVFPAAPPPTMSYAGVRFHAPVRRDAVFDEISVFLGASYFRAVGMGQSYGLSARGLAIDTGLSKAEEFPVFKEFWVEKPAKEADRLTVHALLDSPGIAGAYRFVIRPGMNMTMDVTAHVFFRNSIERLGVAPLTSMYFHGENTDRFMDDFRPEVHDSDGLLMARSNGEWTWRPLNNPRQLRISVFQDINPKGFGLMQRDREFEHYQDMEAHYHQRPGAWVETLGDWGSGGVHLIEIPSDAEKYDNIVAFWVPAQPAVKGQDRVFNYRLHFLRDHSMEPAGGKVTASRVGAGGSGSDGNSPRRKFVVDFTGELLTLLSDRAPVEAEVSASSGKISNIVTQRNAETKGWRMIFELEPEKDKDPVDLRAFLKIGKEVLTETWIYQWSGK